VDALRRAFDHQKPSAAVGVDGVTKEQYGQDLESNLQDLHQRLRSKRWRHQPIRRVHIPKDGKGNKTRPIGISCFEDKIVQEVLREGVVAWPEISHLPPLVDPPSRHDLHRLRHPKCRHPIYDIDGDQRLLLLRLAMLGSESFPDNAFVSVHPILGLSLAMGTRLLPPLTSTDLAYPRDGLIALIPNSLGS